MADAPETPIATQKRPLEDPSSPSGPTDQPDAKRPALDKVLAEDSAASAEQIVDADGAAGVVTQVEDVKTEDVKLDLAVEDAADAPVTDGQGDDTVVPDAPVNGTENGTAVGSPQQMTGHPPAGAQMPRGARNGSQTPMPYHQQDETGWLHMRAIISSAEAATVIGKGGENVSQIRRIAGAKCTVSEYTRGAVERILTQGVRIREIQEASGSRLNASESCLPLSTERSLVVLGVADAVHIASYYVGSTLVEQLTDRFGGPAASNYAGRHGGPQGVVPGGMQVVPYVPQNAGGQMGHPDQSRKQQPYPPQQQQRTPAPAYGMPYAQGPPQHQAQPPMPYGAGSPRAPYVGAGPHQPQPYGHGPPQASHAGPPQQPMQGMVPGQPITQQIFIPNDMVGAIIGKGGAKINEIRQLSGSVIKINEPQDNNNERLVTITGMQECNQMALYMLYSRLGESSKNSNTAMPR
ncbi:PAB1 binding protein [Elasticomyces elasticus]|nr:PAB1 binding protein [Elasticomyces elasticus]